MSEPITDSAIRKIQRFGFGLNDEEKTLAIRALEEMRQREKAPGYFWEYDPDKETWRSYPVPNPKYNIRVAKKRPPDHPLPNPLEYQDICTGLPIPKPRTLRDVTVGEMLDKIYDLGVWPESGRIIVGWAECVLYDGKKAPVNRPPLGHEPRLGSQFPEEKP